MREEKSMKRNRRCKFAVSERLFTPKELRLIAQGCRASRQPWGNSGRDASTPTGLRLVYRGTEPRWGTQGDLASLTQGSSLCSQPWAMRRNSSESRQAEFMANERQSNSVWVTGQARAGRFVVQSLPVFAGLLFVTFAYFMVPTSSRSVLLTFRFLSACANTSASK